MVEERSKREEEINRLFYLQSLYNQQYEAIMNEIATFGIAQNALDKNIYLLDNKDRLKSSKILVNADGGTYVEASIKEINGVVTYVGAGYLIEKDVQQARDFLSKGLEGTRSQMKKLVEEKKKLENELMKIEFAIGKIQQEK